MTFQKKLKIIPLTIVLMLEACSAPAVFVPPSDSTTSARFTLDSTLTGKKALQSYSIFPEQNCDAAQGYGMAASMLFLLTKKEKITKLPAGNRVYIEAKNLLVINEHLSEYCTNFVSFIPEAGKNYEVRQIGVYPSCETTVLERDSASVATSYIAHSVPDSCK